MWKSVSLGRASSAIRSFHTHVAFRSVVGLNQPHSGQGLGFSRGYATASKSILSIDKVDKVAIIRMDDPSSPVNVLGKAFMGEFVTVLDKVQNDPSVDSCVLISSKPGCFIAGADIKMFADFKTEAEMQGMVEEAQKIMKRIETSSKPFVAAINGSCLGGGLEVALACSHRIASTKSTLALPEVMLGLLPGAGGTQRLPQLIGAPNALDMVLTGKNIRSAKAKKWGLVDQVADPFALEGAAIQLASSLGGKKSKSKGKKTSVVNRVLQETNFGRDYLFKTATAKVMKQSGGHYPAPLEILQVMKTGLSEGIEAGYKAEAAGFAKLAFTPQSAALRAIFFGQTACKKNPFKKVKGAKKIEKIAVLGAGLMGAGIMQVSVAKGLKVLLYDRDMSAIARGLKQVYTNLSRNVTRRIMSPFDREATMSLCTPVVGSDAERDIFAAHLKDCGMVIEAVPENLELKHKVLSDVETMVPKDCVIASNTSALPIGDVAAGVARPENVVGLHYFSPVEKMPLLEVITTPKSSEQAKRAAVDMGLLQGKTVICVNDGPGFYTTRILAPFQVEAVALLQQGVGVRELDAALKKFGFPIGPITLSDEVGLDVGAHIAAYLGGVFGARMQGADFTVFDDLVKNNILGRKSGRGLYIYDAPKVKLNPLQKLGLQAKPSFQKPLNQQAIDLVCKTTKPNGLAGLTEDEIQMRVVLRMVNEAVYCLQDGILPDAIQGDIGAVFGLGFPPFLGGPFFWIDTVGADVIVSRLDNLKEKYGERFEAAPMLREYAKSNKKFR